MLSECLKGIKVKKPGMQLLEARPYIRICAVPGPQKDSRWSTLIQPGLPVILQSDSPSHFKLINEWLRLCDEGKCSREGGCCPNRNGAEMPTRVIDLGEDKNDPDTVRLISTDKIHEHYVALSHCWGKQAQGEIPKWCTTRSNNEQRMSGFPVAKLPATFQDAIKVTREIGKRYLWIDSLCIIQGEGGDWGTEAKKMETVFKNAYCTIAATSAKDSTEGFLNRPVKELNLQYVTVSTPSHGKVYVCRSIDNFDRDVQNGVLNTRAWVLQVRFLSRRTIHFTEMQTYWECGGGVRNPFLHAQKRYEAAQIKLFQSLFAEYSALGLTKETDRPVAIDSLAEELAKALNTKVKHGIFERHLHRSLLWQRSQEDTMARIDFKSDRTIPSWSWMAYRGQIKYSDIQGVEWDESVIFVEDEASKAASNPETNGYVLKARVRRIQDCKIKPEGLEHVIRDKKGDEVVHLWFDQEGAASIEIRCAIMGRQTRRRKYSKRKYYVLVVTECPESGSWARVGMGAIEEGRILFDGQDAAARIL
ncbi:hypothetical protein FOMG_17502 [Fusarium oxysporum f. sp. melonis 26406]|uniref:Heterokaryon incompatibility domain-containing protein n=1 Tax=Fusarium oxysporum f. sp. melonis 26406 TaxID=1089452 RepID=W9ZC99_FUSOX|nr:hypothetical protein FOMG_17502 [Fusarium oxysporum f. sp. melonis 26406]